MRENKNSSNKESHGVIKSTSRKEIKIVGDSMIKLVNGREVSRDDSVKIRCHPGATTYDIIDYVRPTAQKVRMVITIIKEIDVNNKVQITFSGVFQRDDQDFEEEIKEINRNLENLCKSKGVKFINNNTLR